MASFRLVVQATQSMTVGAGAPAVLLVAYLVWVTGMGTAEGMRIWEKVCRGEKGEGAWSGLAVVCNAAKDF